MYVEDGLYIIDGGYDPSKVRVKIGKEDVILTKKDAELLNVKPNEKGQYIYKGSGYPDANMTNAKKFDNKFKADYEAFADTDTVSYTHLTLPTTPYV